MRCYRSYSLVLILVTVFIVQVKCNEEAREIQHREKRQDFREHGGHRRPPHQQPHHQERGGGPGRNREDHRGPQGPDGGPGGPGGPGVGPEGPEGPESTRYAQPLSLPANNMPNINERFGEIQDVNNLGLVNNILGINNVGGRPQSASAMGFQSAQNAASLGNNGAFGSMQGFNAAQDASQYGFRAAQNAASGGVLGGPSASPSPSSRPSNRPPAQNSGLLNLGGSQNPGLINLGGQPMAALINLGGQGNGGLLNLGGQQNPGLINIGGQNYPQNENRPQGPNSNHPQQGRPGNNQPGHQAGNRPSGRPGGSQGSQMGRPGERPGDRPAGGSNNQNDEIQGNGSSGQESNSQGQGGGSGGGNKKCRGNQYTCLNRECVSRNARCNGVNDCRDGSDESNCHTSENRPGGSGTDSPVDRITTAAPSGSVTTSSLTEGCILPEQPTGGSYVLGSCQQSCNSAPGTRVPLSSVLTYKCNKGYTLSGNNVSFCHDGAWYLPPTCVRTCSPLKSNSVDIVCKLNDKVVPCDAAITPGTTATMACKHSFKIPLTEDPAYRELTCLEEGIWDRTLFRCLPECGTAVSHGNTLIVNGFTAKLGVFPWHVGIYQKNSAGSYEQICAGTLISPDLVVSAAHCFYDDTVNEVLDASHYAVAAGKHYRLYIMPEKYAQTSLVKKIDVASRYFGASGNFAEDISLVRLQTPFTLTTLVRPICMDWDNVYEREQLQSGQSGKAVGWGKTAEGEPSTELQEINLPYIPYEQCVSAVPEEFRGYVTADKFCAGYLNGSSLCEGDSGGGLCFQLNGLWYLRGIVSVSPVSENTCDNNYYTAFTNVGRFREWIRAAYITMT